MRRVLYSVFALLALCCPNVSAFGDAQAKPPRVLRPTLPDGSRVRLGETVSLTFSLPEYVASRPNAVVPKNDLFELHAIRRRPPSDKRGRDEQGHTWILSLKLLALRTGTTQLDGIQIEGLGSSGKILRFGVPAIKLRVDGPDKTSGPVAAVSKPETVEAINRPALWATGMALVAGIAAVVGWRRWRRWRQQRPGILSETEVDTDDPWLAAQRQLDALAAELENPAKQLGTPELRAVWVDALSDAVREYLGRRHLFPALELTSDELVARLRRRSTLRVSLVDLEQWLARCDLIKFARSEAAISDAKELLVAARTMVGKREAVSPTLGETPRSDSKRAGGPG